jgi:hypothetical protein
LCVASYRSDYAVLFRNISKSGEAMRLGTEGNLLSPHHGPPHLVKDSQPSHETSVVASTGPVTPPFGYATTVEHTRNH